MKTTAGSRLCQANATALPDTLVDLLAKQVRALYVHSYRMYHASRKGTSSAWGQNAIPRWDGGADTTGKIYPPIWPQIARTCLLTGVDPGRLVKVVFDSWQDARRQLHPPTPDVLLSPAMLARAEKPDFEDAQNCRKWQTSVFQVELETLKRYGYREQEAIAQLVGDETLGLLPLFRYCVASLCGASAVADQLRQHALLEFLFNRRGFEATWPDLLPPELIQAANNLVPMQ